MHASNEHKLPVSALVLINFGIVALVVVALWLGRTLLIPFVVALVLVYLINALAQAFRDLNFVPWRIGTPLSYLGAAVLVGVVLWIVTALIANNVADVAAIAPTYQENFNKRIGGLKEIFGQESVPTLNQLTQELNIANLISGVASSLAGIAGSAGLILVYMIFLFLEQKTFKNKLAAIAGSPEQEFKWRALITRIEGSIRKYVAIKTFVSLLTSGASYLILRIAGVDFAEFWALLIFILNYIPTFGSIIATVFPALLTLVQFDTWLPFMIVTPLLVTTQFLFGNVLEPRMMGNSLGISPLVILFSLGLWGALWGIVGMLLCVPITVIIVIILAHFPSSRWLAILLSEKGRA